MKIVLVCMNSQLKIMKYCRVLNGADMHYFRH